MSIPGREPHVAPLVACLRPCCRLYTLHENCSYILIEKDIGNSNNAMKYIDCKYSIGFATLTSTQGQAAHWCAVLTTCKYRFSLKFQNRTKNVLNFRLFWGCYKFMPGINDNFSLSDHPTEKRESCDFHWYLIGAGLIKQLLMRSMDSKQSSLLNCTIQR